MKKPRIPCRALTEGSRKSSISRRFFVQLLPAAGAAGVTLAGVGLNTFAQTATSSPASAKDPSPPQVGAGIDLTIIVIRHAEKKAEPDNPDPDLSPAGQARAQELARMFGGAGINAIYATQYKRTQQTVKPLADKLGLPVTQVDARKTGDLVARIRAQNPGQTVFISGHNNSAPEIVAALGGPTFPMIPEAEFDNLYIVTVDRTGKTKVMKMKYGNPTP
jgi:broad specificity phosphatase PhoE